MRPRQKTILYVAMQNSPHTAGWINLAASYGASLHFFPLDGNSPNAGLRGVVLYQPKVADNWARRSVLKLDRWITYSFRRIQPTLGLNSAASPHKTGLPPGLKERRFSVLPSEAGPPDLLSTGKIRLGESPNEAQILYGPWILAALIRQLKPTLIHSMEFQHAGYLVLKTKEVYGRRFPPWLATNWGSDVFFFGRSPDHAAQLRRLFKEIDYYSCECTRDVTLAREFGFAGPVLPVLPNSGGLNLDHVRRLHSGIPTSRRKTIMVKGYQHFAGRAMTALKVLERFACQLQGYEIVMYSASAEPLAAARDLAARDVLNIKASGTLERVPHEDMLAAFGRARIYLGISISDAISTSALEAMAMGAFPIQTNTSCCDEWFEDAKGGFIVPPDDFELICDRFQVALSDDKLVDNAASINWTTVCNRLDEHVLRTKVQDFYDQVFSDAESASR
jgi:glycosyltransferase involved in cell wall biosynthesis